MDCYVHAGCEAVGICVDCGRPVCLQCKVDVEGKFRCTQCTGTAADRATPTVHAEDLTATEDPAVPALRAVHSGETQLSIGLESVDGSFRVLIPRGSHLPLRRIFRVATTHSQSGLDLHLLQGERSRAADNRLLGRLIIDRSQIATAGRYPLLVTIVIDAKGALSLLCRAQSTGRRLKTAADPMTVPAGVTNNVKKEVSTSDVGSRINPSGRRGEDGRSVYVLLDCSGSMSGNKLDNIIQGVIDFGAEAIKKQYLVGLIKFATHAEHLCEPTKDVNRLAAEMKTIEPSGSSNMAEAIRMAGGRLKDLSGTRVMVVATDGHPDNSEDCLKEGADAKRNGIEIITIGTGDAVEEFLKQLASGKDLSTKISRDSYGQAISSAHALLPGPKHLASGWI